MGESRELILLREAVVCMWLMVTRISRLVGTNIVARTSIVAREYIVGGKA